MKIHSLVVGILWSSFGWAAESFPIIDAHTHTRFDGSHNKDSGIHYTQEAYLAVMKRNGGVGLVSHTGQAG